MWMPTIFREIFQSSAAQGSRTSAMGSMIWLIALLLLAVGAVAWTDAEWVLRVLSGLLCLAIASLIGVFIWFAIRDPDLLRSERFNIAKAAMEHGYVGDDLQELLDDTSLSSLPKIEQSSSGTEAGT